MLRGLSWLQIGCWVAQGAESPRREPGTPQGLGTLLRLPQGRGQVRFLAAEGVLAVLHPLGSPAGLPRRDPAEDTYSAAIFTGFFFS